MKFLKYILLLIVAIVVVGLIYAATIPSNYNISRSKVLKATTSTVFNTVNEMKTWEKWGPWHDEDSTIVVTYGEKTSGVGAYNSWTSKDGPGNMKTVSVIPNKSIKQKMQFEDFEPTDIIWTFKSVDEGTKVTWEMKQEESPYIFKIFAALSGGWDNMLGPMLEDGLNNLEEVVLEEEKLANSFTISSVNIIQLPAQNFIGFYHKTNTEMENITKLFETDMPKAGMYAMKNGLKYGEFTPAAVYDVWDEENNIAEFYIGILLKKDLKPGEGMTLIELPKGTAATTSKFGNYGIGDKEVHETLFAFVKEKGKEVQYPIWELYVNDPTMVKLQEIQTDYFYSIK